MPRPIHKLKALSVERLRRDGRYSDGGGLYLSIKNGGRSWLFMFRSGDKRRELGLGPVSVVSLEAARGKAADARRMLVDGKDPLAIKREATAAAKKVKTFGQYTTEFLKSTLKAFKNEKHRDQWRATLITYAKPLWDTPLPAIMTADVFAVLQPIWHDKHETARRLRGRIERILSAAKAAGLRTGDNPARWPDNLKPLLHKPEGVKNHFKSLPYADAPAFMTALRARESISARALEFAILCASRTGEVILATWAEIDIPCRVWTIPAVRMKMKREHRVPLTARAIEILETMNPREPDSFVFPGARRGEPLSDMALLECVRQIRKGVTTHGMRSTFSTWRAERTAFAKELAEFALAHKIEDESEAAYQIVLEEDDTVVVRERVEHAVFLLPSEEPGNALEALNAAYTRADSVACEIVQALGLDRLRAIARKTKKNDWDAIGTFVCDRVIMGDDKPSKSYAAILERWDQMAKRFPRGEIGLRNRAKRLGYKLRRHDDCGMEFSLTSKHKPSFGPVSFEIANYLLDVVEFKLPIPAAYKS